MNDAQGGYLICKCRLCGNIIKGWKTFPNLLLGLQNLEVDWNSPISSGKMHLCEDGRLGFVDVVGGENYRWNISQRAIPSFSVEILEKVEQLIKQMDSNFDLSKEEYSALPHSLLALINSIPTLLAMAKRSLEIKPYS